MENGIRIEHGYYDGEKGVTRRNPHHYIPMAVKLRETLHKRFLYYASKHNKNTRFALSFTFGIDPENHIEALSICHPSDQFDRKDGRKRVVNRIHQLRINSENFDWKKYPWIYKMEK